MSDSVGLQVMVMCGAVRQVMEQKKGKQAEAMPKLTKKQEELLAAQRQRESDTRQRLTQVSSRYSMNTEPFV